MLCCVGKLRDLFCFVVVVRHIFCLLWMTCLLTSKVKADAKQQTKKKNNNQTELIDTLIRILSESGGGIERKSD